MKFSINDIFSNLQKASYDAIAKVDPKVKFQNTAIVDGNVVQKDGEYQLIATFDGKADKSKAKKIFETYLNVVAGEDVAKKVNVKDILNDKDTTFSVKYDLKAIKNLKESKNMKNNKTLVMEADAKPTFEISPNELLGKLHQAALDQVEKKYGNVISLFNTAIDTNQDPPIASLADGIYKIKMKLTKPSGDKKRDKQTSKDALKLYLTWFAGKDVAKTADKPKWFIFKSKLDKAKEKNADGTQGYTVHYKMNVEKVDDKKNEKAADDSAAKESISYHFGGNKKVVVECNELFKLINTINESKKINKTYVLKESEEVVEGNSKKPKLKDVKTAWTEAGKQTKQLKNINDCKKLFADKKEEIEKATSKIEDKKLADALTTVSTLMEDASNISESELNENALSDTLFATLKLGLRLILCILWLIGKGFVIGKFIAKILAKVFDKVGNGLAKFADNKSKKLKDSEIVEKTDKPKESSFIINPSELIGKLHEAAMQAMIKKYGKKCTIINTAIDEDHKPPICTTKPGQYKIVVKQLKKGLFGSTKAAKEAIKLYLTVFAGEDVAKDILKARFFILKSKLEKGKHEGQAGNAAGYSVYYQLDRGDQSGENESMSIGLVGAQKRVFECKELVNKLNNINESKSTMSNELDELVKSIDNDDNVKADAILEKTVQDKILKRMAQILDK